MDSLQQFARFVGITDSYVDGCGKAHKTTNKLYKYLLSAMNYRIDNQKSIQQEYDTELNNLYKNGLDYTNSFFVGGKFLCNLYIKEQDLNKIIKFIFVMEDSEKVTEIIEKKINKRKILDTRTVDGEKYVKTIIYLQPKIPFGYYKLICEVGKNIYNSFLLASPNENYLPKEIQNKEKLLGIGVQLYGLTNNDENYFGMGGFRELSYLIKIAKICGINLIGLNPLGVLDKNSSGDFSPYRTLSRHYINYLYTDITEIIDYKESKEIQKHIKTTEYKRLLEKVKNSKTVDYKNIFKLKFPIFHLMYKNFIIKHKTDKWQKDFEKYKKIEADELLNLCKQESLLDVKNESLVDFYTYLHFITHTQFTTLKQQAEKLGIGLYLDIPVGAYIKSSEVKYNKKLFMKDVLIGSPPEKSRPFGQDWGVVPASPMELLKTGYKSYRKLLSSVMKFGGAVRIDHAFSLMRLFCIAKKLTSKNNGAYINYNFNHFVSILLIEAHKNKCLVIGEDLGVAPTGFNKLIKKYKIFSNKVVYYNKNKSKLFIKTGFPYYSLCQISTHDNPTSKGFWSFEDIKINNKCELYKSKQIYQKEIKQRQADKKLFYEIFKNNDCFVDNEKEVKKSLNNEIVPQNIEYCFNKYGFKTGSSIFMLRLEDLIGDIKMQNVPAVDYKKYPVWSIKLEKNLNEIEKIIKDFVKMNKK